MTCCPPPGCSLMLQHAIDEQLGADTYKALGKLHSSSRHRGGHNVRTAQGSSSYLPASPPSVPAAPLQSSPYAGLLLSPALRAGHPFPNMLPHSALLTLCPRFCRDPRLAPRPLNRALPEHHVRSVVRNPRDGTPVLLERGVSARAPNSPVPGTRVPLLRGAQAPPPPSPSGTGIPVTDGRAG